MFRMLYSDHGYRRPVESWNAADVRGEDGLLHHGTVIGAGLDGLIIDFGYDGQRRQLVRYGEAFGYWGIRHSEEDLRPGCAVEVLLRLDDKSPWVWRPATLVTADPTNRIQLALVDVQLGGEGRREVVHYEQIRPPSSPVELHSRVLWRDVFDVRFIRPVPDDIAALLPTHSPQWKLFCQHLSEHERARVSRVSVSSSELRVLFRKESFFGSYGEPGQLVVWRAQHTMKISMDEGVMWMNSGFRCCLPVPCGLVEVEENAADTKWNLQNMPLTIVAEVFSHLETMQQIGLRRLCSAFNEPLSSIMSAEICLTYRECGMGTRAFCCSCSQFIELYPLCAPLLKCVTARTRRIILTHGAPGALSNVLDTLKVCRQLGQYAAGQRILVVAGQCDVGIGECFWENADDLAISMAGGWCKLLLKHCTMDRPLDIQFCGSLISSPLRETSLQVELCQLIESQLPVVDIQRTGEWVASVVQNRLPEIEDLVMDLQEFTSADPRKGSAYAGSEWNEDDLTALDVSKLSRVAQYALSRYVPPRSA